MITHHPSSRITELPCCIKVTGYMAGHTAVSSMFERDVCMNG